MLAALYLSRRNLAANRLAKTVCASVAVYDRRRSLVDVTEEKARVFGAHANRTILCIVVIRGIPAIRGVSKCKDLLLRYTSGIEYQLAINLRGNLRRELRGRAN